tara:strand:- start:6 stop:149 length:144 start_codon:yes stop_codon:yes gene_type:complete
MEKAKCPCCGIKFVPGKDIEDDWDKLCANCLADITTIEEKLDRHQND